MYFYARCYSLVIKLRELNAGMEIAFVSADQCYETSIVNCTTLRIPLEYLVIGRTLHAYQGIVIPQESLHIKAYQTALSHTLRLPQRYEAPGDL